MDCIARAAYQVEWNYNQFRRRVKRWIPLPEENTEADIAGVAAKVFAGTNTAVIKKVISYVFSSGRDLSALGDVATELRELLGTSDLSKATFKQVDQIIRENLYPSDNAFLTQMELARKRLPKGQRQPAPALPVESAPGSFDPVETDTAASAPPDDAPKAPGSRHRHATGHRETTLAVPTSSRLEAVLTAD